jgi:outer membrane protein TolC
MKRPTALVVTLGLALWSSLAAAQEAAYQPPDFIRAPVALPPSLERAGVMRLGIEEAVTTAIRENLGVVLSRQAVQSARLAAAASRGRFEPVLSGSYRHFDSLTPPATAQEGTAGQSLEFASDSWNIGAAHDFATGTRIGLDFSNSRSRSNRGTAVEPLLYRSGLDVSVSQSLLRGFSFDLDVPSADILRAELSSKQAAEDMRGQMLATVQTTENAYWDLIFSLKSYQVQRASLDLAQESLELTKKQITAGLLAPANLIEAESALAQRRLTLVQAEASIVEATDALRQAMGVPRGQWSKAILPTDAPDFVATVMGEEEAMRLAAQHRPELRSGRLSMDRAGLDLRVAENNRLPLLDVTFSYGLVGQEAQYADTVDQLFSNDSRSWSVFLNMSWTPLGRQARAQIEQSKLAHQSAESRLARTQLQIYRDVRRAVRDLDTAARQLRAAAKFRDLAARSLDAEQRKFMAGTSSNFLVTQRQDGLRQAQQSELQALIRHKQAITTLQRTTGTLLDARKIEVTARP